jgi:hypothetical protein
MVLLREYDPLALRALPLFHRGSHSRVPRNCNGLPYEMGEVLSIAKRRGHS